MIVLIIAMVFTSLWSWTIERVAYRPLRGSFRLAPLISAIGMSIFLSNFVQVVQGPRNKSIPPMFNDVFVLSAAGGYRSRCPTSRSSSSWSRRRCSRSSGIVAEDAARPRPARLRAGPQDGRAARRRRRPHHLDHLRHGRRARRRRRHALPVYYGVVNFSDGFTPGVKAFTAAVLGGIGSLPGAVLGGLLIGLIEVFWSAYFSVDYKDVAAFSILAIVLIFMPQGLLGRPDVEKV
jgi:branched-chain amino acid transport system permease protein